MPTNKEAAQNEIMKIHGEISGLFEKTSYRMSPSIEFKIGLQEPIISANGGYIPVVRNLTGTVESKQHDLGHQNVFHIWFGDRRKAGTLAEKLAERQVYIQPFSAHGTNQAILDKIRDHLQNRGFKITVLKYPE